MSRRPGGEDAVAVVSAEVLRSRRYRWVAPDLVHRLAAEALGASRHPAEAVKRTKRRLHQVCGAYVQDLRPEAVLDDLRQAQERDGVAGLRSACRVALGRHASTRERLPVLDHFYTAIFERTGAPAVLLDVACGLGPLCWPWMGLPETTTYLAYDVDQRLVSLAGDFLSLCAVPHVAETRDVVTHPPDAPADVALLLKSAPCLEQQAPGSTRRLLDALAARHVVLSYPTRSLGGVARRMVDHYRSQLDAVLAGTAWEVDTLAFPAETVYVLSRPRPGTISA